MKLLFVCSRNRWRSPTAEKLFHGVDGLQARSAATEDGARVKVTAGHLGCLRIPDDFQFIQPELIALLESTVTPHLAAA